MADWPLWRGSGVQTTVGADVTDSLAVTATGGVGAHAKGAYAELVASAADTYDGFWLYMTVSVGNQRFFMVYIAVGAAGGEVDIISKLPVALRGDAMVLYCPLKIQAGSRIAVAIQSAAGGSQTMECSFVGAVGNGGWPQSYQRATVYGSSTATSRGTAVTPSTVGNTKGAFASLTTATTNPMRLWYGLTEETEVATNRQYLVDFSLGVAGSEVVQLANVLFRNSGNSGSPMVHGPFGSNLSSGQAWACRGQRSTASTAAAFDAAILAFD